MTELVATNRADGVVTLTLNRPEKKNALNGAMYLALAAALENAEEDPGVAVVVLTGTEGCFCAGNDIGDFVAAPQRSGPVPAHRFITALCRASVPLIAAVDGPAVGIGTTMLLHCDFVYAAPTARFALPFVNLGLVPEAGSSATLVERVGYIKAAELLMLGEPFDAEQALRCGLLTDVCPGDTLDTRVGETARALAAKPPGTLRASKQLMRRSPEALEARVAAEIEQFNAALERPAAQQILQAFLARRTAS